MPRLSSPSFGLVLPLLVGALACSQPVEGPSRPNDPAPSGNPTVPSGPQPGEGTGEGEQPQGSTEPLRPAPTSRTVHVTLGAPGVVTQSPNIRQFPWVHAVGKDVLVGYSEHLDGYLPSPIYDGMSISRDEGINWPEYVNKPDFTLTSLVTLRNGTLLGVSYITRIVDPFTVRCDVWTTADLGKTWVNKKGLLRMPQEQGVIGADWGGLLFHKTIIEEPDGTLYATVYGRYKSDGPTNTRVVWVRSKDLGSNWEVVSTMAFDPSPTAIGWSEPVVARVADGSLLAIYRIGELALRQGRSYDNGLTWSEPQLLPGVPSEWTFSVDPDLTLTSDGVLVLSYGRPGTSLLFSPDGSGYSWERYVPTEKGPTTGYTGIRETSPGKLVLVGDRGKFRNPYEIWRRTVELSTKTLPGTRLNLGAMKKAGKVTVTTNMNYVDPVGLPGTGVDGAIDGSLDYSRSAFKSGTAGAGEYVLALDRTYAIRAMGVLLKVGHPESAEVFFSADGTNWGSPVKNYVNVTQTAVDYTTFASPLSARYVKVVATASGWPGLNELELFVDDAPTTGKDTFENDAVDSVPEGYALSSGQAAINAQAAAKGQKALRVFDTSTTAITRVVRALPVGTSRNVEFAIRPVALTAGALIDLVQGDKAGIHLAVTKDGALSWYDGAKWIAVTPNGTIPFNAWTSIRVDATSPSRAALYVGGKYWGTARGYVAVGAFDGLVFGSGSTAGTGDDFFVDEVDVR